MKKNNYSKSLADIISALEKIGFEKKEYQLCCKMNYKGLELKIYPDTTYEEVFKKLLNIGGTLKIWEIHRVLEVPSPIL